MYEKKSVGIIPWVVSFSPEYNDGDQSYMEFRTSTGDKLIVFNCNMMAYLEIFGSSYIKTVEIQLDEEDYLNLEELYFGGMRNV